jgi:hypothetical protein
MLGFAAAVLLAQTAAAEEAPPLLHDMAPLLLCDDRPIQERLLGADWEFHGCNDHRSVMVLSPKGRKPVVCVMVLRVDVSVEPTPCNDEPRSRALVNFLQAYTRADWKAILAAAKYRKKTNPAYGRWPDPPK